MIPPMAKSGDFTLNIPGRHPDAILILQYVEQNSLSFKLCSWTKLDNFKDGGVTLDQCHKCYDIWNSCKINSFILHIGTVVLSAVSLLKYCPSCTDFSISKVHLQFLVAYEWVTPYSCSILKQRPISHQICGKSQGIKLQKFFRCNTSKKKLCR